MLKLPGSSHGNNRVSGVRVAQVSPQKTSSWNGAACIIHSTQLVTRTLSGDARLASAVTSAASLRRLAQPWPLM